MGEHLHLLMFHVKHCVKYAHEPPGTDSIRRRTGTGLGAHSKRGSHPADPPRPRRLAFAPPSGRHRMKCPSPRKGRPERSLLPDDPHQTQRHGPNRPTLTPKSRMRSRPWAISAPRALRVLGVSRETPAGHGKGRRCSRTDAPGSSVLRAPQAGLTTTCRWGSSPSDSLVSPAAATASWTTLRSNGVMGSKG